MTNVKVTKSETSAANVAVLIKAFDGKLSESRNIRNALIAREMLVENFKRGLAKSLSDSTGVQQSDISTIAKLAKSLTVAQRKSVTSLVLPTGVDDVEHVSKFAAVGAKFFVPGSRKATAERTATVKEEVTAGDAFATAYDSLIAAFDAGTDSQRAEWAILLTNALTPDAVAERTATVEEVAA